MGATLETLFPPEGYDSTYITMRVGRQYVSWSSGETHNIISYGWHQWLWVSTDQILSWKCSPFFFLVEMYNQKLYSYYKLHNTFFEVDFHYFTM